MITENTFRNMAQPMISASERLTLSALSRVRAFAIRASTQPKTLTAFELQVLASVQSDLAQFGRDIRSFSDTQIAEAYIRGIQDANGTFSRSGVQPNPSPIPGRQIFASTPAEATPTAIRMLTQAGYGSHAGYVGAFQQAIINQSAVMQMTILRDVRDVVRRIGIEAGRAQFLEADVLTRRGFTRDIVNRFANEGIAGVRYANGAMMPVESYSEMLSRTMLGNASSQATLNRTAELGGDLIRTSVHARCSPMCEPYQGNVYSLSGRSEQYPPFDEALDGGYKHPNCKHSESPYFPGVSEAIEPTADPLEDILGDPITYEAEQQQRYYERGIRQWKRREAVALTPEDEQRAKERVSLWQGKQREHLDVNPYLRRQYQREQI